MTVELVTGFADTPHIDAADDGALNAAVISDRNHVLGTPSPAVMRDSNHLTVPTMEALFLGRHVRVTSAEDVTITSGSQGLKRHDIVGFRYSRDPSTNVETAVLDVIRGTASSTPADPALPLGSILTGDSIAFMPLYRVPMDGINVGTPVPLFNVLGPMRELWDSANQLPGIKSQISGLQNSANQLPGIKSQISGLQNSVTQAPKIFQGSKIFPGGEGSSQTYVTLWTPETFQSQFGIPYNPNSTTVVAMNGQWEANQSQVTSTRILNSSVQAMFDKAFSNPIRVNWLVVVNGNS